MHIKDIIHQEKCITDISTASTSKIKRWVIFMKTYFSFSMPQVFVELHQTLDLGVDSVSQLYFSSQVELGSEPVVHLKEHTRCIHMRCHWGSGGKKTKELYLS